MPDPFIDLTVATRSEDWYEAVSRLVDRREERLLARLRRSLPETCALLAVDGGTRHFTRPRASPGWGERTGMAAEISPELPGSTGGRADV